MNAKKLQELFKERDRIYSEIYKEAARMYPLYSIVRFKKGRATVTARVVHNKRGHNGTPSLFIENISTGKEYHIDIYDGNIPELLTEVEG